MRGSTVGADVLMVALAELAARTCEARAAGIMTAMGETFCWATPPFAIEHHQRCAALALRLAPDQTAIIPDAGTDARLAGDPHMLGPPPIRFFASLPVLSPDGHPAARLVVADDRPRDVSAEHRMALCGVADIAGHVMSAQGADTAIAPGLLDLIENAPVGLHVADATGTIHWMNATELRWLGYTREEVIGMSIAELLPPERLDTFRRDLSAATTTGRLVDPEAVLLTRDRRRLPVHLVANSARGSDDAVNRIRAVVLERAQTRGPLVTDALLAPNRDGRLLIQVKHALEASGVGAWYWDLATSTFRSAGPLFELFGDVSTSDEHAAERLYGFIHEDDRAGFDACVEGARQERTGFCYPHRVRARDGSVRSLVLRGRFRYDSEGQPVAAAGIYYEAAPPSPSVANGGAERQMASLLEGISDGFVALDGNWRYTYINRKAAQMFGRIAGELIGRSVWEEFPEAVGHPFQEAYERARREGIAVQLEAYYEPWGRWVENRIYPTPDGGLSIYFTDVTERHQRSHELAATAQRLRDLSARLIAVREEEAAHLAREIHDGFGQSLTALKLDLSWLTGRVGDNDPAVSAKLRGAISLVDELFASIRRMAAELRPRMLEDLGLAAAIEWYAKELESRTGLVAVLELDMGDLGIPHAAEIALYRVLQEALTNVVRHAAASRIVIRLSCRSIAVVLEIADDGIGASPATIAGSDGLGLLGMRERMLLVGGELELRSSVGNGTVVTATVVRPA